MGKEHVKSVQDGRVKRVLFLCTHNRARSQMAEGLLRSLSEGLYEAFSAGIKATYVRGEAVTVMKEIEIDISNHESKTLDQYIQQSFDIVVTVCDDANEACPAFPNAKRRLHWSIDDPSRMVGSRADRLQAFRRARDELKARVEAELLGGRYDERNVR